MFLAGLACAENMRFWHTSKHGRILDEDPPARLLLPGGLV
jgi:hypothetical protein